MLKFSFINKQQELINVEFLQHANTVVISNETGTKTIPVDETFFNAIEKSKKHNNVKTWSTIANALNETLDAAHADFLGGETLLHFYSKASVNVIYCKLKAAATA